MSEYNRGREQGAKEERARIVAEVSQRVCTFSKSPSGISSQLIDLLEWLEAKP